MKQYELIPVSGQKSFYHKAVVYEYNNGNKTLYSYNTPIITETKTGELIRLWAGWSTTTGRHIKSFCGLNKKEFEKMPVAVTPAQKAAAYNGILYR